FVGVTLLGHTDADFFAYGAQTQLPLVGITVPVEAFFIFAPVMVAALYAYLHLYLMSLWDTLADAPATIDGQPLSERIFPWLMTQAALWYRNRRRGGPDGQPEGCAAPRALGRLVVVVSVLLGWLFAIAVIIGLWVRSMPAHEEWLTLWIAFWLWFAVVTGVTGLACAAKRMAGVSGAAVAEGHWVRREWTIAFAAALAFLSWQATEGNGVLVYTDTGEQVIPLYPADLVEAELTRKSPGWLPYAIWLDDFEVKYRAEKGVPEWANLNANRAFIAEAIQRYNASFSVPDLKAADLLNADMFRAFLPGADFRDADLKGADLSWAELQGAILVKAQMQGAIFISAEMQGANLFAANMQRADLSRAQMQGANLAQAQMQNAILNSTNLQGAILEGAQMQQADLTSVALQGANLFAVRLQGAILRGARLQGAELTRAAMQQANLFSAEMQGTDLRQANLQGAILRGAEMQGAALNSATLVEADLNRAKMLGAVLSKANMQGADCDGTNLDGALLKSAKATCNNLIQAQLDGAVGDSSTVLPRGLSIPSCLKSLPEDVEAALALHPEVGTSFRLSRAQIRDELLCAPGEEPHAMGSWP
ncbi:MAG TPA: pentapeptide repeat-containing protein, partial [Devosiaceae bacterium]|nr:pentapeptide repeat-containing protein [Devosiaceae bacterium]